MDAIVLLEQLGADPHSVSAEEGLDDDARKAVRDMLDAAGKALLSERSETPAVFSCLIMTPDGEEADEESPSEGEDDEERGSDEAR